MRVSERALLVQLHIHRWGSERVDEKVTSDVAAQYGIEHQEDRYIKRLVPSKAIRPILNATAHLRQFHYDNTLPWQDRGIRVLPSKNYFQYVGGVRQLTDVFEKHVAEFVKHYNHWVSEAKKLKKQMFKAEDYPNKDEVAKMFGVRVVFLPFPDAADFRVDLDQDEVDRIRKAAEAEFQGAAVLAVQELKDRIAKLTAKLYSFMVRGQQFRQNSIDAIADLMDMIPRLNLTNDAQLNDVRTQYYQLFRTVRNELIRSDPLKRKEVIAACSHITRTLGES